MLQIFLIAWKKRNKKILEKREHIKRFNNFYYIWKTFYATFSD